MRMSTTDWMSIKRFGSATKRSANTITPDSLDLLSYIFTVYSIYDMRDYAIYDKGDVVYSTIDPTAYITPRNSRGERDCRVSIHVESEFLVPDDVNWVDSPPFFSIQIRFLIGEQQPRISVEKRDDDYHRKTKCVDLEAFGPWHHLLKTLEQIPDNLRLRNNPVDIREIMNV